MILEKLQPHTIKIYRLDNKKFQIKTVKAKSLLTSKRFDLFAKLYYIANRNNNSDKAIEVYAEHIKTFNPDLKEPGRTDKNSIKDFINVFDFLITEFNNTDFNNTISLIPVDSNGIILDGAHRIATLAYYDKSVTIVQFEDVRAKCDFNFVYFKERGLDWDILDIIAHEMTKWLPNLFVACIWPRVNSSRDRTYIENYINSRYTISYLKQIRVGLSSLTKFVKQIYINQEWTNNECAVKDKSLNCYSSSKLLTFVFFEGATDFETIINDKTTIRDNIGYGKHSIHITDNAYQTNEISELVNTHNGISQWYKQNKLIEKYTEELYYFKNVQWLNFKIKVAKLLLK